MEIMTRKELFKQRRKRNGTPSRIFVSRLPTSSITKILKRSGITCNSFWKKSKRPAKSSKRKASIHLSSWNFWKRSMRMSLPLRTNKRKNLTKMPQLHLTSWSKNSETKSFLSLKLIWKKFRSLEKTTHQEMRNRKPTNQKKVKKNLTLKTRIEATGALRISWSEESISWKSKSESKVEIKTKAESNQRTSPKKMDNKLSRKRSKKRKSSQSSTWRNITRRNPSKLSPSNKLRLKFAT